MTIDDVITYHAMLARKRYLSAMELRKTQHIYKGQQLITWFEIYNKDIAQFKFHNQVKRTLKGVTHGTTFNR